MARLHAGTGLAPFPPVTAIEFFIIYLSLGAPVAMHALLKDHELPRIQLMSRTLLTLAFWPAALGFTVFGDTRRKTPSASRSSNEDLRLLTETLIELFKAGGATDTNRTPLSAEVRAFRQLCERYTGLSNVARLQRPDPADFDTFFDAAGHPNVALASICLRRVDRQRLGRHRKAAATEFRRFFEFLPQTSDALLNTAAKTAAACGDVELWETLGIGRDDTSQAHSRAA